MATRTETRFGVAKAVGSASYVSVCTIPGTTTANILVHLSALLASNVRLYIATGSWSTGDGEPVGAKLVETLAYDMPLIAGEVAQLTGVIVNTGEQVVARASVAAAIDVGVHGVAIT